MCGFDSLTRYMSADRWAICTNCVRIANKKLLSLKVEIEESYGNIPREDYEAKRAEYRKLQSDSLEYPSPTFREDYEVGLATDAGPDSTIVVFDYSGRCTECSWGIDINERFTIPPK